jgi:hypothetical protein
MRSQVQWCPGRGRAEKAAAVGPRSSAGRGDGVKFKRREGRPAAPSPDARARSGSALAGVKHRMWWRPFLIAGAAAAWPDSRAERVDGLAGVRIGWGGDLVGMLH